MTNHIFIHRCEIVLTTMLGGNISSANKLTIAKWLEMEVPACYQVLIKMRNAGILTSSKVNNEQRFALSASCIDTIKAKQVKMTLVEAIASTVKSFLTTPHKEISHSMSATDCLQQILEENKKLKSMVKKYQTYYKTVKGISL